MCHYQGLGRTEHGRIAIQTKQKILLNLRLGGHEDPKLLVVQSLAIHNRVKVAEAEGWLFGP